jgi:hypothetical protein
MAKIPQTGVLRKSERVYLISMQQKLSFILSFLLSLLLSLILVSCGGGGPVTPPGPNDPYRPIQYDLLVGNKVCRWDSAAFPLDIYVDPPPAGAGEYGPSMKEAAEAVVDFWNNKIDGVAIPFRIWNGTDQPGPEVYIRWQSDTKSAYTNFLIFDDHMAIDRIAVSVDLRDTEIIKLLVSHELGHVLGLGHSHVNGDLMFPVVTLGKSEFTERDHDMINWLYNQETFTPITTPW